MAWMAITLAVYLAPRVVVGFLLSSSIKWFDLVTSISQLVRTLVLLASITFQLGMILTDVFQLLYFFIHKIAKKS